MYAYIRLIGGTETTATTLEWAIFLLVKHQEIQKRVFKEIHGVLGNRANTCYTENNCSTHALPYAHATLCEILRFSTIMPLSLAHRTMSKTHIRGYTIPKNTAVLPNIWSVHRDPTIWPDPDNFNPGNFLSADGKIINLSYLIPFSKG